MSLLCLRKVAEAADFVRSGVCCRVSRGATPPTLQDLLVVFCSKKAILFFFLFFSHCLGVVAVFETRSRAAATSRQCKAEGGCEKGSKMGGGLCCTDAWGCECCRLFILLAKEGQFILLAYLAWMVWKRKEGQSFVAEVKVLLQREKSQ